MKILCVVPFFRPAWRYGGIVRAFDGWTRAMVMAGMDVSVYTTTADGAGELHLANETTVEDDLVRVKYYARSRWLRKRFVSRKLLSACLADGKEFDLVHSAALWNFPALAGSFAAAYLGVPSVVSLHGSLMPWAYQRHSVRKRILMNIFERVRLQRAKAVVCASRLEEEHFLELGICNTTAIIPNVVDTSQIRAQPEQFRDRYNLGGAFIFLFSGRRVVNKGLRLTISAFARVAVSHPAAHLVVVGPEEDRSGLEDERHARQLGLDGRVTFTGLLTGQDYWDALASANVCVLNSLSENFGLGIAEAMALGVPVLVSDQVGLVDLIQQYNAGLVVQNDVDAITEGMQAMLNGVASARTMGQNGIRLVSEHCSPSAVGGKWIELLGRVVGTRSS